MTARHRRTWVAGVVTLGAIATPCAAWYVAGSRAAALEARRLEQEPIDAAHEEATRLAGQLKLRLESLRQAESRRPHTDYQSRPGFSTSDCADQLRIDSSLAEGPPDPLIWTHFQMDEVGQLSLPAFAASAEPAIQEELECAASSRLGTQRTRAGSKSGRLVQSADGATIVGPLEWLSAAVSDRPALVALRSVDSPRAVLTQGFVVLSEALDRAVADGDFPARVVPGEPAEPAAALLLLGGQPWSVVLDATAARAAAALRAEEVVRRFRQTFLAGTALAALAGMLTVALVWQSERLAVRRAQFAAAAAHELRTPLAGLQLYGEMLAEGRGEPAHRERYARRIAEEAARLGRVVSNVLGYTQLERGSLGLRPEAGDLALAVRESIQVLGPALEARGVTVAATIEPAAADAVFDRDAVHQILQNLLDNAEKYTRESAERRIEVRVERGDTGPVLSVVDHGPGIPRRLRHRVFEPFVRNGDASAPAGLGIGLALVRGLAVAQGASVAHADEPGGGTRFSVTFRGASSA